MPSLPFTMVVAIAAGAVSSESVHVRAAPDVYVANVDAIIHPVSAEYMIRAMDRADAAGAALIVFELSTPGGLVESTRAVVSRMLSAKTPVAVFVTPSGARAASAGFILTMAADIAAMSPGTHIGAAHPVGVSGGDPPNETMKAKIESDVAAYARTLAEGRRRNVALAQEAVVSSRSFTEQEAIAASPPLIDLIARDVPDLLRQLDARTIRRFDGSLTRLQTSAATTIAIEMSTRQRLLSALAHPNIAFLLLTLGMLGLTIELWSPGSVFPGVVGAISLLLAFFALQLLPVNYTGVLLLMLGLVLLLLELKVTSYGLLTIGGAASLVLGAMMLIDAPEPDLRLGVRFVAPVVGAFVIIAAGLVRLAVAAQRQESVTGASGIIGAAGQAVTTIEPGTPGQVRIRGELWRAVSADHIPTGAPVTVLRLEGLTLTVRLLEDAA